MRGTLDLGVERTPSRPGPGAVPDAVLRALDVTVRRRVESLLPGDYRASALGRGTELAQIRQYVPGDDVRLIDWNVTARLQEPHVRVHVAERALASWLVLDTSPSMQFGTADRRKADVAEGVALALGYLASRRGNRVGLVTFGDDRPVALPPRQGRVGLIGVLSELHREPTGQGHGSTSLGEALARVSVYARQRAFMAVVSDLRGPRDWRQPLIEVAGRHDVLAIEVRDPREQALPDVGVVWMTDPETGAQVRVDTHSRKLRERFAAAAADDRREVAEELRRADVGHLVLSTEGDWLADLALYLRTRGAAA